MTHRHTSFAYSWKTPKSQETGTGTGTSWVCMALRGHDMRVVEVSPKRRSARSALSSEKDARVGSPCDPARGAGGGGTPVTAFASVPFDGSAVRAGDMPSAEVPVVRRTTVRPVQHTQVQYAEQGGAVMVARPSPERSATQPAEGSSHRWPGRAHEPYPDQPDSSERTASASARTTEKEKA